MMTTSAIGHLMISLMEDRIDVLISRYPGLKLSREILTQWSEFDPTENKKYLPWIVGQVASKKLKLPAQGENLRDNLMTFERVVRIPEFVDSKDIQQYTAKSLEKILRTKYNNLQSKSQREREARSKGVTSVAKDGPFELLKITNAQELVNYAWSAYAKTNPNWRHKPVLKPSAESENHLHDGLWCVRYPHYASSYLTDGAFYLVLKNGGPYVGIVWGRGECQTLDNDGISLGTAEEIYPVVKDVMPPDLTGHCTIFNNLKFLRGDVPDGSVINSKSRSELDLSHSSLKQLPSNLTVNGVLDVSFSKLTQLPPGLTVNGLLKIQGTSITKLPLDLKVEELEWSAPLPPEETKKLFYYVRLPAMKDHFMENKKVSDLSPEQKELEWDKFKTSLLAHFLVSAKIAKSVNAIYRQVKTGIVKKKI